MILMSTTCHFSEMRSTYFMMHEGWKCMISGKISKLMPKGHDYSQRPYINPSSWTAYICPEWFVRPDPMSFLSFKVRKMKSLTMTTCFVSQGYNILYKGLLGKIAGSWPHLMPRHMLLVVRIDPSHLHNQGLSVTFSSCQNGMSWESLRNTKDRRAYTRNKLVCMVQIAKEVENMVEISEKWYGNSRQGSSENQSTRIFF